MHLPHWFRDSPGYHSMLVHICRALEAFGKLIVTWHAGDEPAGCQLPMGRARGKWIRHAASATITNTAPSEGVGPSRSMKSLFLCGKQQSHRGTLVGNSFFSPSAPRWSIVIKTLREGQVNIPQIGKYAN